MNASLFPCSTRSSLVAFLLAAGVASLTRAEPLIPRDDARVLERVTSNRDPVARELRERHARLSAAPGDLSLASDLARRYIELNRAEGDPRYLGRAQSVLAPWWDDPAPPAEALVLRATLKQSLHDFSGALRDLDAAVRLAPANAQAWLTRATVLTVRGEYEQARPCCLALARLAPELAVVTASATIAGLTGQAERSCAAVRQALERNASSPASERVWALTVSAETWQRLGRGAEAEACFRQALALGERDLYLIGAYADFLLESGRADEAAQLLQSHVRVDGLLLRLALAESAQRRTPASLKEHLHTLRERFAEGHLRGDFVHQREEARFALALLHQPTDALRLAKANWDVQREPADVRILLEAALEAGDPASAVPAVQFVQKNKLEDVRIQHLCESLKAREGK